MKFNTYQSGNRYQDLHAVPVLNLSLPVPTRKSSLRYQMMQQQALQNNAGRLHTVALAGGGEIKVATRTGSDAEKLLAAKIELKKKGLNRAPILDVKDAKADFSGMDLRGVVITGKMPAKMIKAKLEGATFHNVAGPTLAAGADMRNTTFRNARIDNSQMRNVNLSGAKMEDNVSAVGLQAPGAKMNGFKGNGGVFTYASFAGAHMDNAEFQGAQMAGADLGGAQGKVNLTGAKAQNLSLRGARMELSAHNADLSGADMAGAQFHDSDFSETVHDAKTFAGATLTGLSEGPKPKGAKDPMAEAGPNMTWMQRYNRMMSYRGLMAPAM